MKATEVIVRLQELIDKHGDLECGLHVSRGGYYPGEVENEIESLSTIDLDSAIPKHYNIGVRAAFVFDA